MRNALVFLIFAESIWQLKDIAMHYFGGIVSNLKCY